MKHVSSFIFVFIFISTNIQAFTAKEDTIIIPKRMLNPTDSIEVTIGVNNSKFLNHTVQQGQTLYSIASYYGLDASDLYLHNPSLKNGAQLYQNVKIPISASDVKWQKTKKFVKWRMIEVVYTVKPKDTIFKIAKTYFKIPVDSFRVMNNLAAGTLEIGDKIIVGWIDIDGIPEKVGVRSWMPPTLETPYKSFKEDYIRSKNGNEIEEKGPAVWTTKTQSPNLYALHKTAPVGTIMKVTNPLNHRTIYVKVVGQMQTAGYKYDTILVISPAAAKALGGVNRNFRVNVTYYL